MRNRPSEKQNNFSAVALGREAVNIVCVGTMASFAAMPFEAGLQYVQTKNRTPMPMPLSSTGPSVAARVIAWRTVARSIGAGVQKNAFLQHRDSLAREIESRKAENESTGEERDFRAIYISPTSMVLGAAGIGFIDAVAGNHLAVQKTFDYQQLIANQTRQSYQRPIPTTMIEKVRLSFAGLSTRTARCGIGVFGLVITPSMATYIAPSMPTVPYIDLSNTIATALAGGVTGLIGNGFDVVNKKQLIQVSPITYTAPSMFHIGKDIMRSEGVKGFGRGAVCAMLYQIFMNKVVQGAEKVSSEHCMPAYDRVIEHSRRPAAVSGSSAKQGMFKPSPAVATKPVVPVNQEENRQTKGPGKS